VGWTGPSYLGSGFLELGLRGRLLLGQRRHLRHHGGHLILHGGVRLPGLGSLADFLLMEDGKRVGEGATWFGREGGMM
jgi:hypothetical protein